MDLQIAGEVAVVIGGAGGIGRAITTTFAAEGAHVAIVDRDSQAETLAVEVSQSAGVTTQAYLADVTDYQAMRQLVDAITTRFGRFDHVVYAAAIGSGKFGFPFWNLEPADWGKVLDVNLLGAANVAHAFGPAMTGAGRGSIVFLSSVAGQIGSQTDPPYSASKAALINFAQCAAKDLAPHGVRVNTVCPGMVVTPLNRSVWQAWHDQQPPDKRVPFEQWTTEKIRQLVPMGRWQEPQEIADMVVFLTSARAKNITGQTINVDGGYVMHW